jgi:hypothetical protein
MIVKEQILNGVTFPACIGNRVPLNLIYKKICQLLSKYYKETVHK